MTLHEVKVKTVMIKTPFHFIHIRFFGSLRNTTPQDFTNPTLATKGLGLGLDLTPSQPLGLGVGLALT